MQEHDSKTQNPIIANVLYKSKFLKVRDVVLVQW